MDMDRSGYISNALSSLGISYQGKDKRGICPFCGHKTFFANDELGIFSCRHNSCNRSGGLIDFATFLYPNCPSKAEAMTLLNQSFGTSNSCFGTRKINMNAVQGTSLDYVHIDKVYKKMIDLCELLPIDRNDLIARGYSKQAALSAGYISFPRSKMQRLRVANKIMDSGLSLNGVPGFEKKDGTYLLSDFGLYQRMSLLGFSDYDPEDFVCYLCPSYDMYGRIQFFQIAWDKRLCAKNIIDHGKEYDFPKYSMLSTPNRQFGAKAKALCGYAGPYKSVEGRITADLGSYTSIAIIEGVLKTNLYYHLSNGLEPCISQVGVSNYKSVHSILSLIKKEYPNITTISDCYDMDKFDNENVKLGSLKLKDLCDELGFTYEIRIWNKKYKGLDDFYLHYLK